MKKTFILFAASAAVCALLSACSKENLKTATPSNEETGDGNYTITFIGEIVDPENAQEDVKTVYHDKTIWWKAGDVLKFGQGYYKNESDSKLTFNSYSRTIESDTETYSTSIGTSNPAKFPVYYFSVCPSQTMGSILTDTGIPYGLELTLPYQQSPAATAFDPMSDILASELIEAQVRQTSFNLRYMRRNALAKMTITNLPAGSVVKSITFNAIKDGKNVRVAGCKKFSLITNEVKGNTDEDTDFSIVMNYAESMAMTSGMTAHFTCWPFELGDGDSFKVIVETYDGLAYEKNVTLSGRDLKFVESRGTQFTVNMATAEKTCAWLSLSPYSSGSYVPTIEKTYAGLKGSDIVSVKWCTADMATFSGITDFDTYIESNGADLSESGITNLNSGKTQILQKTGTIDTEYAFLAKATNNAGQSVILTTTARTDWFKFNLVTRSAGGVQVQLCGKELDSKTKNYRIVASSALEGLDAQGIENYYTTTLAPGDIPTSTLDDINNNPDVTKAYGITKYYTDKSTQANMESGVNYTIMMKVTNTRGETKFCTASANAK